MRVGIIGCGFVFDKYMATWDQHPNLLIVGLTDIDQRRVDAVTRHYGFQSFSSTEALLADPTIDIVVNLTPIRAHYAVTKAALEAGKHVYSEKPLVTDMRQARELMALAESRGLRVSCAPSNPLGATSQSMWKAVVDGAVGDPRVVYAEFDAGPSYLVNASEAQQTKSASSFPYLSQYSTVSVTGAPFPYLKEFEMGCTYEHVGYHLSWMCAMFGPVRSVMAFSKQIMPDKTDLSLDPPDTPDLSVAVLDFHSGVVGRVTCSLAGQRDTSMLIIGSRGILYAESYGDYRCPVYLETFTKLSIKALYVKAVRESRVLRWLFGIGRRRVPLVSTRSAGSPESIANSVPWWAVRRRLARAKLNELNRQDKCIGIAELAESIETGRPTFPSHDFTLHLTELTIAIQAAGTPGQAKLMETTFEPLDLPPLTRESGIDYKDYAKSTLRTRIMEKLFDLAAQLGSHKRA